MRIIEKLKQSKSIDNIYFYRERMFVQLYGVSLYLALEVLNLPLTMRIKRYKKLANKPILQAALLDKAMLNLNISGLTKTEFGYILPNSRSVDLLVYRLWHDKQLKQLLFQERS